MHTSRLTANGFIAARWPETSLETRLVCWPLAIAAVSCRRLYEIPFYTLTVLGDGDGKAAPVTKIQSKQVIFFFLQITAY